MSERPEAPRELYESDDPTKLPEYLTYFPGLVQDLDHWLRYQITTPRRLAEYLDWNCASDLYKDRWGVRPRHWKTVEEARAYLQELDEEKKRDAEILAKRAFEAAIVKQPLTQPLLVQCPRINSFCRHGCVADRLQCDKIWGKLP